MFLKQSSGMPVYPIVEHRYTLLIWLLVKNLYKPTQILSYSGYKIEIMFLKIIRPILNNTTSEDLANEQGIFLEKT